MSKKVKTEQKELGTPEKRFLLALVNGGGGMTLGEIAHKAKVKRESAFVAVKKLRSMKDANGTMTYIRQTEDKSDGVTTYDATTRGKKAVEGFKPPVKAAAPFSKIGKELGGITHFSQLRKDGTPKAEFLKSKKS